jgi:hypothetical protein
MMRETASVPPPAAQGQMSVMGRSGYLAWLMVANPPTMNRAVRIAIPKVFMKDLDLIASLLSLKNQ